MSVYPVLRHTIVPLFRWRVRVTGTEHIPPGASILVANHQSYLDPPLVWLGLISPLKRKLWFVTKEYIWRSLRRLVGVRGIAWMGILPMQTGEKAQVLDLAVEHLRAGEIVVVFPEGTRNRNAEPVLLHGRTGAARLALATGAPVVPIGIIAPPGLNKRQAIRNFFSRRPAVLTVGKPIQFSKRDDVSKELLDETTATIMRAIGALCGKEYRG